MCYITCNLPSNSEIINIIYESCNISVHGEHINQHNESSQLTGVEQSNTHITEPVKQLTHIDEQINEEQIVHQCNNCSVTNQM